MIGKEEYALKKKVGRGGEKSVEKRWGSWAIQWAGGFH